eukprot:353849-Chlamydomonas_euryale.AAC.2
MARDPPGSRPCRTPWSSFFRLQALPQEQDAHACTSMQCNRMRFANTWMASDTCNDACSNATTNHPVDTHACMHEHRVAKNACDAAPYPPAR